MEKLKRLFWQFFKFGLVGASSTIVNAATYFCLVKFLACDDIFANIIGWLIATYNGYFWQTMFVFKGDRHYKQMIRVFLGYVPCLFLTSFLTKMFIYFGIPAEFAQLPTLVITVPTNFIIQKKWAYKE